MLTNQNQYITGIIACARPLQPLLAANAPFSTRSLSFIYLALLPPLSNTTKPTTSKDTRKFGNTWPAAAKHRKYQCSSTASFFYPLSSSLVLQYGILYYGGIIWCEERKKLGVPADVDGNTGKHVKKIIDEKLPPWLPHPSALLRDDGRDLMLLFSPFSLLCFSLLLQLLFRYLIMRLLFCFSSFVTSRQRRWCYFLSCLSKGIFCLTRCISTLLILTPLTPQALIGFICKSWFLVGHSITIVFHPSCAFSRSPAACRIVGQQEQSANVLIESIIL